MDKLSYVKFVSYNKSYISSISDNIFRILNFFFFLNSINLRKS